MTLKQLLLVNDLAGVGKVAISGTLPIISATQTEACLLPTVLLSSHTGFANSYRRSLTDDMVHILSHWKTLDLHFDGVLTGYFGDAQQVRAFIQHIPHVPVMVVDPVMADHGKFYTGFDDNYVTAMQQLVTHAQVLIPNITEACLLAGIPYLEHVTEQTIQSLLDTLQKRYPNTTILVTGISYTPDTIGVAYITPTTQSGYCLTERIPQSFFGTGDIFSALFTSLYLQDIPLETCIQTTLAFIVDCLKDTLSLKQTHLYGVVFEKQLPKLIQSIQHIKGEHHATT